MALGRSGSRIWLPLSRFKKWHCKLKSVLRNRCDPVFLRIRCDPQFYQKIVIKKVTNVKKLMLEHIFFVLSSLNMLSRYRNCIIYKW